MYADTPDGAVQCLTDNATEAVTVLAAQRVQDGTAVWRSDPNVVGVWALVRATDPNRADVVVYCTAGDFELSDEFEEAAL